MNWKTFALYTLAAVAVVAYIAKVQATEALANAQQSSAGRMLSILSGL